MHKNKLTETHFARTFFLPFLPPPHLCGAALLGDTHNHRLCTRRAETLIQLLQKCVQLVPAASPVFSISSMQAIYLIPKTTRALLAQQQSFILRLGQKLPWRELRNSTTSEHGANLLCEAAPDGDQPAIQNRTAFGENKSPAIFSCRIQKMRTHGALESKISNRNAELCYVQMQGKQVLDLI